jgi:hypothetical protein
MVADRGTGGGAVLDQVGDLFGGAQIGLVDDARFAIDAGAFDDVVVELIAIFLGNEGSHIRVIRLVGRSDCMAKNIQSILLQKCSI